MDYTKLRLLKDYSNNYLHIYLLFHSSDGNQENSSIIHTLFMEETSVVCLWRRLVLYNTKRKKQMVYIKKRGIKVVVFHESLIAKVKTLVYSRHLKQILNASFSKGYV